MWVEYNANPRGKRTGDCAVRAVALALDVDWNTAFDLIVEKAKQMGEMPSKDSVWSAVLRDHGFLRRAIPNFCPECYTVAEFASEHFRGMDAEKAWLVMDELMETLLAINSRLYNGVIRQLNT